LEFNVPFQHKYGYIRDEAILIIYLYLTIVKLLISRYLSQQMLDAIKHITDDNFFFQEDNTQVHCNTIQLSEKCDFRVSPFCQVVQKHKLLEVA